MRNAHGCCGQAFLVAQTTLGPSDEHAPEPSVVPSVVFHARDVELSQQPQQPQSGRAAGSRSPSQSRIVSVSARGGESVSPSVIRIVPRENSVSRIEGQSEGVGAVPAERPVVRMHVAQPQPQPQLAETDHVFEGEEGHAPAPGVNAAASEDHGSELLSTDSDAADSSAFDSEPSGHVHSPTNTGSERGTHLRFSKLD